MKIYFWWRWDDYFGIKYNVGDDRILGLILLTKIHYLKGKFCTLLLLKQNPSANLYRIPSKSPHSRHIHRVSVKLSFKNHLNKKSGNQCREFLIY